MSHVTNAILSVEISTSIFIVQEHLRTHNKGAFTKVDHHCGGMKEMELALYIAGFNYLNLEGLILVSERLEGDYTLMVQGQHENTFRIVGVREE